VIKVINSRKVECNDEVIAALAKALLNHENIDPHSTITTWARLKRNTGRYYRKFLRVVDRPLTMFNRWGFGGRQRPSQFTSNDINEEVGLVNRVLMDVRVDAFEWGRIHEWTGEFMVQRISIWKPLTYDEYIEELKGSKKARAREEIETQVKNTIITEHVPTYRAFLKMENSACPWYEAMFKDPRIIQGCDPVVKHELGRFFRAFSKVIKARFPMDGRLCYGSGYTPVEHGYWMELTLERIPNASFYELDYSRWDAHMSRSALETVEHAIQNTAWDDPGKKGIEHLLSAVIGTRGITKNGFAYATAAGRHSGDPDTSVGNSVINAAVWGYYLDTLCGAYQLTPDDNYRVIVLGDDSLTAMSQALVDVFSRDAFERWARTLGMVPEGVWHLTHHKASFCSQYYYPCTVTKDGESKPSFVLAPKPGRYALKTGWYAATGEERAATTQRTLLGEMLAWYPAGNVVPGLRQLMRKTIESALEDGQVATKRTAMSWWKLDLPDLRAARHMFDRECTLPVQVQVNGGTKAMIKHIYGRTLSQIDEELLDKGLRDSCIRHLLDQE
jgi:hypothetical protein